MDSESCYSAPTSTRNSCSFSDPFSTELLIQSVDEVQKKDQLQSLEVLANENNNLCFQVLQYQREWCSVIDMLEEARRILATLQKALIVCFEEQMRAERDWLAFWQVPAKNAGREAYSPAGWI